jgi:hypothetical protein
MKTILITASTLILAGALAAGGLSVAGTTQDNAVQARALIQQFASTLQGELKAALKEGGPVAAVQVCKDRAPGIAAELSEQSGWDVGRTSLKTRNAALNSPDEWEKNVLEEFESRKQNGESSEGMSYAAVVQSADGEVYRYMQAIPTGEVCLACHGKDITPDLAAALDKAYPDDQARGFELGDIRGAFTLSKPM